MLQSNGSKDYTKLSRRFTASTIVFLKKNLLNNPIIIIFNRIKVNILCQSFKYKSVYGIIHYPIVFYSCIRIVSQNCIVYLFVLIIVKLLVVNVDYFN